jgi:radical SAM protein with 4Fe4S-binding SPASM domain
MIVDRDLHGLLAAMDGKRPADELAASRPSSQRKATIQALQRLHAMGVVSDGQDAPSPGGAVPASGVANVSINVTSQCNLRCRFCYNLDSLTTRPTDELSAEEIVGFLDSIRPHLTRDCSLTLLGGEPLLVADKTLALARYGRKRGWQTIVSTNGHRVTDDFARQARRAGLQVQVSLDGASADLHDRVRGPGAFDRTLSGIRGLVSRQAHTILSLVCHRENLHCLEPFYALARELGVNEARFIPLKRLGGACKAGLEPVDPKDLVVAAASLFREHPEFRALLGRDALSILATTCAHSIRQPSCGTGLRTFLLDANGDLYPCLNTHVPGLRVANIRDPGFDFGQIWNESALLNRVRQETSLENPRNKCYNCIVKYWCLGYCRGETLQATGSLANRAVDCSRQREAILDMFWLLGLEPDTTGGRS